MHGGVLACSGGLHENAQSCSGGPHGNVGARARDLHSYVRAPGGLRGYVDDLGPAGPGGYAAPRVVFIVRGGVSGGTCRVVGGLHSNVLACAGGQHGNVPASSGGLRASVLACSGRLHDNVHACACGLHDNVNACACGLHDNVLACAGGQPGNDQDSGPAGPGGFAAPISVLLVRVSTGGGRRCTRDRRASDAVPGGLYDHVQPCSGDLHSSVPACSGDLHSSVPACSGGQHGYDHDLGPAGPGGSAAPGIALLVRVGTGGRKRNVVGHQTSDAVPGG